MSTQLTPANPNNPYLKIIDNCNRVVDSDEEDERPESGRPERRVAESKLVKFLARDAGGEYRTFGYLTQKTMGDIHWGYFDFETVPQDEGNGIYALKEVGKQLSMSGRFLMPTTSRSCQKAFPLLSMCRPNPAPFLPLLGGPPEVRVPRYVLYFLGAARHEVHLTVYNRHIGNRGVQIWVRKRAGTGIYPGAFEQVLSGTVEHGEDEEVALDRLVGDHKRDDSFRWRGPRPQKQVSYLTVGGEEAGQLAGVVDAGIVSSYSHKVHPDWVPNGAGTGLCRTYTPEDVTGQLLRGEWTPGSALSVLRWLVSRRYLGWLDSRGYNELSIWLYRELPHWRAMECAPDRSKSAKN